MFVIATATSVFTWGSNIVLFLLFRPWFHLLVFRGGVSAAERAKFEFGVREVPERDGCPVLTLPRCWRGFHTLCGCTLTSTCYLPLLHTRLPLRLVLGSFHTWMREKTAESNTLTGGPYRTVSSLLSYRELFFMCGQDKHVLC